LDARAAAVVDGKVYAAGGRPLDPDRNFDVLESYDPSTDTWTRRASMPTARGGVTAVALQNRLHTYGGETTQEVFAEHAVYDTRTDAWTSAPPLPTPRHGAAAAILGNQIYVIGGGPQAGLAQTEVVEIYTP